MEKFYPIKGFEGYYEITKKGQVKSVDRYVNSKGGSKRLFKGTFKRTHLHRDGYAQVAISIKDLNIRQPIMIHRLLALTFLENPNNFPCVNHIDGNKQNNDLDNLEWCTQKYNSQHYYDIGYKTPNRHLNCADAYEIRELYKKHMGSQKEFKKEMSDKYNVSTYVIHDIILNRSYNNLNI